MWVKRAKDRLDDLFSCRCCGITQSSKPHIVPSNSQLLLNLLADQATWADGVPPDEMKWRTLTKIGDRYFHRFFHPIATLLHRSNFDQPNQLRESPPDTSIKLCSDCHKSLDGGQVPKWSLYHSYLDYGLQTRLPQLTLAEQIVISLTVNHVILKLNSGQFAHKGHFISFAHDSAFATSLTATSLPRTDLTNTVMIVNIGPNRTAGDLRRHASVRKRLEVRAAPVYEWLAFLKKNNPLYRDIVVKDDDETKRNVNRVTDQLVEKALQTNDEMVVTAERVATASHVTGTNNQSPTPDDQSHYHATADNATTNTNNAEPDFVERVLQVLDDSINHAISTSQDDDQREVSDVFITERNEESIGNANNLPTTLEMASKTLGVSQPPPRPSVTGHHDTVPVNSFTNNDQLIMGSYPSLFPLWTGTWTPRKWSCFPCRFSTPPSAVRRSIQTTSIPDLHPLQPNATSRPL